MIFYIYNLLWLYLLLLGNVFLCLTLLDTTNKTVVIDKKLQDPPQERE